MATPEHAFNDPGSKPRLRVVDGNEAPSIRSVFAPFASTHPSMPPLIELDIGLLYGGVLEPTSTSRLRAVLDTLRDTYPKVRDINVARTVLDFERFLNRTVTIMGEQIKFSEQIDDPAIPRDFLVANSDQPRYCAVSRAMLALIELDTSRNPQTEPVIGSDKLLRLGHTALFAVGQQEYTTGYREIMRSRASS
ncbi:hypothetical protein H6800_03055 [Candidatus Nomurabacteria bacterium]|nr:hypothetical protein [Candidatus Nomurabacteria bacterium]